VERHLLPEEIDLLLDGEVGFGTAPLKAHARQCAECRAEIDAARALVRALEHLPHFAPSPLFAAKVMSEVHVFVPWHVALLDSVSRFIPRSRGLRWAASTGLVTVAVLLTVVAAWAYTRLDSIGFAAEMLFTRARTGVMTGLQEALSGLIGDGAMQTLQSLGGIGAVVTIATFVVVAFGAATALRAVAVRGRTR